MSINSDKNYTCERNSNFKITFPNQLVVSIWFEDHDCTEVFDENRKLVNPAKEESFSFNQADLSIFNKITGENETGKFCSRFAGYSERANVVYGISPSDFADVVFGISLIL